MNLQENIKQQLAFMAPNTQQLDAQVSFSRLQADHRIPDEDIFIVAHQMQQNVPLHQHDFYEFIYVINGTVLNLIDDEAIYILPNSLFLMNLQSRHALKIVDSQAIIINIGLRKELFAAGVFAQFKAETNPVADFLRNKGHHSYLYYPLPHDLQINATINYLVGEYARNQFHSSYSLQAFVLLLLDQLQKEKKYSYYGVNQRCMKIISMINSDCQHASLSALAQKLNFNENYLSRYVKKYTGNTVSELIQGIRLKKSCSLLTETDLSIEKIAQQIGYASTSHFYRIFKANLNVTPETYRQNSRIQSN
ncbi:hypothetical protein IV38_GL002043 [Lactobacillus selangorensis]|uniref:HTH araC/xylS-type domain-containing protein n=1 Tax=Lactobacillus selangorensis TaxID=81857 RepID=A0A0R2FG65_9LACO|nr:AraC family transcriptional regulator [Lactobacillus selangorensis]KRN27587.1 hypothetical protein IV38_GL002043 [Lactobacillus selangorensis]KRN30140.1 hypothetical protein IV40_GL001986 [Lactobacillus selangorensis]